jgi:hypothetical protein
MTERQRLRYIADRIHVVCQISRSGTYTITDPVRVIETGSCIEVVDEIPRLNPNTAWHATVKAFDHGHLRALMGVHVLPPALERTPS